MFSRDNLPTRISKECGIVNLDSKIGSGTLWICYRNIDNYCEYFASWYVYTQIPVNKWKTNYIYSGDEIQERDSVLYAVIGVYSNPLWSPLSIMPPPPPPILYSSQKITINQRSVMV